MLKPRLRMPRPKSIASSARAWPTMRVSEATSDVVTKWNRFGSQAFRSSSGFRALANGTLPIVRRREGSLDPEVDPAVPQLFFPLRGEGFRLHEEDPPGFHLPRSDEAVSHVGCALPGKLPEIVVRHLDVRQHQLLHFGNGKGLGHADDVAGLREFLHFVGPGQVLRVFRRL